jgi:NADPH-dependent curcumin reductase CurA
MAPTTTRQLVLKNLPVNDVNPKLGVDDSTYELKEVTLPDVQDGELLLQTIYLSNDPAQRGWMDRNADPKRLYVKPIQTGEVMRVANAIYKVVQSKSSKFKEGDLVNASHGWVEYAVAKDDAVRPVPRRPGVEPSTFVGLLGGPGLTAYFGELHLSLNNSPPARLEA